MNFPYSFFKKLFSYVAQGILVLTVAYAGSFILMEENFEKTERTEAQEEAIYYEVQTAQNKHESDRDPKESTLVLAAYLDPIYPGNNSRISYNIRFIYFTSFLEM